jgi:hypothetical protein
MTTGEYEHDPYAAPQAPLTLETRRECWWAGFRCGTWSMVGVFLATLVILTVVDCVKSVWRQG